MHSADQLPASNRLRLLVAIASYGQKNIPFLKKIIQNYKSMAMDVDIVVLSEAPKDVGAGVEIVVGLPDKNPWSLPFAHKAEMARNAEKYDLFVYTEDDIEVAEANIQAFLRLTASLQSEEIAGYLRYEIGPGATKLLTDVHGAFHWKPESVKRRGPHIVAEFTNEHAGFYILTQSQLKRAIASGGFLKAPYEGRYGLPETAATDPYTRCGFRKVVCISMLDDFLIRHMSNLYVERHGVSLDAFRQQVQTLTDICDGRHVAETLCGVESKLLHGSWSKSYYEQPDEELIEMIPSETETILSIGCGCGATEAAVQKRGAKVTVLPLDSVVGASAERLGMEVIYGTLENCLRDLRGRQFHCVLITNLLHLMRDPGSALRDFARFVLKGGTLVAGGPNFSRVSISIRRICGDLEIGRLTSFEQSGISVCGPGTLSRCIRKEGMRVTAVRWLNHATGSRKLDRYRVRFGRLTAKDWIFQARR
ncbi:MAG TPA: class I SAM-dependent methyltransferase [Candidatus Angelobacter sp.]|nr:class I SAM-dependent methyltransferase [Candidatus Angelobacter sp.]